MSRFDGMEALVAVVEQRSLSGAALALGVSVAHVSRQLKALEQRLGSQLIKRSTRQLNVTDSGELYYRHARALLDGLAQAEDAVATLEGRLQGRLRVTAATAFGERYVAPALMDFLALHPALKVDLILSNANLDLVADGIDLAIRLGRLEDSSLIARKLAPRRLYICASPAYLQRAGVPASLNDLKEHSCLLGTQDHWLGKGGPIRPDARLRMNSGELLLKAALDGLGLVQLPDYYVLEHLQSGALVEVLAELRPPDSAVWALYPARLQQAPRVARLVEHLQAHLDQHLPR
ncbi:LysR substrate-binding domain-containing protein [Gallaecimonas kandeliae]|uniref:LysR substrate-binding domain-containing protein n=1 Tax=Gallaecimonas kandeliae TaxID=3029055 RepID=UPI0026494CEA|nr:LysR substrate-binding domain-containing protein [Gallaecimonas kandeliae]WKE66187.1 LysR substrate-binding domain-containing protein [Gallaecimonas kandeliae]